MIYNLLLGMQFGVICIGNIGVALWLSCHAELVVMVLFAVPTFSHRKPRYISTCSILQLDCLVCWPNLWPVLKP